MNNLNRQSRPLARYAAACAAALLAACTPDPTPSSTADSGSETANDDATTDETTDDGTTGGGPAPVCAAPDMPGVHSVTIEDRELDDPLRDGPLQVHLAYPADDDGAPYPLVVFSHGFAAYPAYYDYLFELLASHGFVVFGAKHHDSIETLINTIADACETIPESEQPMKLAEVFGSLFEQDHPLRRPADLSQLIDHAEALTASDPALAGRIDLTRVGVVGHSFGGFSSLMASAAQVDSDALAQACVGGSAAWLSNLVVGDPLLGLMCFVFDSVTPESLSQPFDVADERVKAVATLAGPLDLIWGSDANGLGAVELPALMVYTDTDQSVLYPGTGPAYASFNAPKHFLTLAGGTHANFGTFDPVYFDSLNAQIPESCTFKLFVESMAASSETPTLAPEEQTRLTGIVTAAFLQHHLTGATGCEQYLTPEYYESVGGDVADYVGAID